MTGMFYDPATHRIYYTVSGDSQALLPVLHPGERRSWAPRRSPRTAAASTSAARPGLTLASGRILYGSSDGALRTAPFAGGRVTGNRPWSAPTVPGASARSSSRTAEPGQVTTWAVCTQPLLVAFTFADMAKVMRWVALAAFCAVFGFVGSVVGVRLMADDLRGEQGPPGVAGLVGPQGDQGIQGEAGTPGDVSSLESRIALVRTSLNKLTPRVKDLETKVATPPPGRVRARYADRGRHERAAHQGRQERLAEHLEGVDHSLRVTSAGD